MADHVLRRIAAWEAEGLIEPETADLLRRREADEHEPVPIEISTTGHPSRVAALDVEAGEALIYLGSFFLLGAWLWFVGRFENPDSVGIGIAVAAVFYVLLGFATQRSADWRVRRSTGLWYLVGGLLVTAAVGLYTRRFETSSDAGPALFIALSWLVAAGLLRRHYASRLTQIGLIGAIVAVAGTGAFWTEDTFSIGNSLGHFTDDREPAPVLPAASDAAQVLVRLAWVLAATLGIMSLAAIEIRRLGGPPDGWRLAITRFCAGLVAVLGSWAAVTPLSPEWFMDGAGLGPFIGDLLVLTVSGTLIWLAVARGAASYLYPGALGVLIGLSDLNRWYLEPQIELGPALLVEGVLLVGVGLLADRVRRRLSRSRGEALVSTQPV